MTTQTAAVSATFARLADRSWGVRVNGPRPTPGTVLAVSKRDGSTSTVTVSAIIWHGTARDGQLASLVSISSDGRRAAPGCCAGCGDQLSQWERQHGVRRCADCRDGGSHARGGQSYHDRHGRFVLGDDD